MGRLIDADKLLETLQNLEPHCDSKDFEHGMLKMMRYYMPQIINDEPSAFDVDKVVEQLKTDSSVKLYGSGNSNNYLISLERTIEIVKAGGNIELSEHSKSQGNRTGKQKATIETEPKAE